MNDNEKTSVVTPPSETKMPAIKVVWNEQGQCVGLQFDPKEFRSWDYVIGLLGMAQDHAREMKQQAIAAQLMEMQQAQALRQKLAIH